MVQKGIAYHYFIKQAIFDWGITHCQEVIIQKLMEGWFLNWCQRHSNNNFMWVAIALLEEITTYSSVQIKRAMADLTKKTKNHPPILLSQFDRKENKMYYAFIWESIFVICDKELLFNYFHYNKSKIKLLGDTSMPSLFEDDEIDIKELNSLYYKGLEELVDELLAVKNPYKENELLWATKNGKTKKVEQIKNIIQSIYDGKFEKVYKLSKQFIDQEGKDYFDDVYGNIKSLEGNAEGIHDFILNAVDNYLLLWKDGYGYNDKSYLNNRSKYNDLKKFLFYQADDGKGISNFLRYALRTPKKILDNKIENVIDTMKHSEIMAADRIAKYHPELKTPQLYINIRRIGVWVGDLINSKWYEKNRDIIQWWSKGTSELVLLYSNWLEDHFDYDDIKVGHYDVTKKSWTNYVKENLEGTGMFEKVNKITLGIKKELGVDDE
jgi:hypothetical protein